MEMAWKSNMIMTVRTGLRRFFMEMESEPDMNMTGNRVEKKGIQRFVGNEIVPIHTTYQYDIRGQLLEENHQEEPAGVIFRYGYDVCGNRIEKEENSRRLVYTYNGKN